MRAGIVIARGAAVAGGLALLAGCASTRGGDGGSTDYGSSLGNLLAFNSLTAPAAAPAANAGQDATLVCPTVEVLDGTASSRVYGSGDQSNANVKYQFSMGDVVRECSRSGGDLVLKIGVEGRVVIGPAGAPGSFTAPVRIAIRRDKDEKVVAAKLFNVAVTVPPGDGQAPFMLVSEPIPVPFLTAHGDDDYTILVGFDSKGGSATKTLPRKPHARGA